MNELLEVKAVDSITALKNDLILMEENYRKNRRIMEKQKEEIEALRKRILSLTAKYKNISGSELVLQLIQEHINTKRDVGLIPAQKTRQARISRPRQEIQWVMTMLFNETPDRPALYPGMKLVLADIGNVTGGYHHATVIHSYRTIENLISVYPRYAEEMREILNDCKGIACTNLKSE